MTTVTTRPGVQSDKVRTEVKSAEGDSHGAGATASGRKRKGKAASENETPGAACNV